MTKEQMDCLSLSAWTEHPSDIAHESTVDAR